MGGGKCSCGFIEGKQSCRLTSLILMGACSRIRAAGQGLPKVQRSPSASPQAWGAPLPPPVPGTAKWCLAVSQGRCWVQQILLMCSIMCLLMPSGVSDAGSHKAPNKIHCGRNCGALCLTNPSKHQGLVSLVAVQM